MATPEERVEQTEQVFKELADEGREWVELEEVALRAMMRHQARRRETRSRAANSIIDFFRSNRKPSKPSFGFRHQTAASAMEMEADGRLEHRFIDKEGHLRKKPPGRLDYRDRRYRLVAAEAAKGTEISPQDRFEGIARRIEALPKAQTMHDGEGQESTAVRGEFEGHRVGFESDMTMSPPTIRFHLSVGYLPTRDGVSEREPRSILASSSQVPGNKVTYEALSFNQLNGDGDQEETARILGALEDAVTILELTQTFTQAEEKMAGLYERSFAPPAVPSEAVSTLRRSSEPPLTM